METDREHSNEEGAKQAPSESADTQVLTLESLFLSGPEGAEAAKREILGRFNLRGLLKPRRTSEPRILNEEEFKNQKSPEGGVSRRDALRSPLSPKLKRFALKNYQIVRNSVARKTDFRRSQDDSRMMGSLHVTPLLEGSSKGAKRPQSFKMQVENQTARELLRRFDERFPNINPAKRQRSAERIRNRELITQFGATPFDTGSTAVQIALQTNRIETLKSHFQVHKKDKHSKRGFMQLIQKRKALLKYLRREDQREYERVLLALNLRK